MFESDHANGEIMEKRNLRTQINVKGVEFYYFYWLLSHEEYDIMVKIKITDGMLHNFSNDIGVR